jgi:hypothetical protein
MSSTFTPSTSVSASSIGGLFPSPSNGGGYVTTAIADPTWSNTASVLTPSGQIELKGDQADLVINGVSLTETLKGIQDRLNMLRPNTALEAEWDQLRELGQQYRQLEAELKEKQRAWEILRKQG